MGSATLRCARAARSKPSGVMPGATGLVRRAAAAGAAAAASASRRGARSLASAAQHPSARVAVGDASFDAAMDLNVGNDEVRATLNTGGFQFGSSPLLREWIDGSARLGHRRPMLDVGCAFGANVFLAARALRGTGAHVVALDCDTRHLDEVMAGAAEAELTDVVSTAFGRLPDNLAEADLVAKHGTFSSILVSEVFHFLSGAQIEASCRALASLLAPGGTLVVTAAAPSIHFADSRTRPGAAFRRTYDANVKAGARWPGECKIHGGIFNVRELVFDWQIGLGMDEGIARAASLRQPTGFHLIAPELLAAAVEAVPGMRVMRAGTGKHHRYPVIGTPTEEERQKECTQLVATKDA